MMERANDRDVVLGRTLAGTAGLNSPEHLAGAEAGAAMQRAGPDAERIAQNRRRFRIAVLKEERRRLEKLETRMLATPDKQISADRSRCPLDGDQWPGFRHGGL